LRKRKEGVRKEGAFVMRPPYVCNVPLNLFLLFFLIFLLTQGFSPV
jgi:hypothetical protein